MSAALASPRTTSMLYVQKSAGSALPELSMVKTVRQSTTIETAEVVPPGSVGTIVMVHDGGAAYDVEFDTPVGVACLPAEDIVSIAS